MSEEEEVKKVIPVARDPVKLEYKVKIHDLPVEERPREHNHMKNSSPRIVNLVATEVQAFLERS